MANGNKWLRGTLLATSLGVLLVSYNNCSGFHSYTEDEDTQISGSGGLPPVSGQGLSGAISFISDFGRVSGWAMDESLPSTTVTVEFYVNGSKGGGGTFAGSINATDFAQGIRNGHGFAYDLPAQFRTGSASSLYVYAVLQGREVALANGTLFAAYIPKAAGQAYYESTLRPLLSSRCANCHGIDYMGHYYSLIYPSPFNGGTRSNNELLNKASGRNHGGGNRCGGAGNSPCAEIQQWWDLEFQ